MRNYINSPIDLVTRCHFGGGGKAPKAPKFSMPAMPEMPAPPPPPPPPPEAQTMSAADASNQQRLDAAKREGFRKSIIAGETGGYANPATGKSSLLG